MLEELNSPPHPFPLLQLPQELRFRLQNYVLHQPDPIQCDLPGISTSSLQSPGLIILPGLRPFPSIMFANRQLHSESRAVLARESTLYIYVRDLELSIYNTRVNLWTGGLSVHRRIPQLAMFHKLHIHVVPEIDIVGGGNPGPMVSTHYLPPSFHYLVTLLNKHRDEAAQPWSLTLHIDATAEEMEFNYDFNMIDILKAFRWLRHVGDLSITGLHGLWSAEVDRWINDVKYGDKDRPNLDLIFDALRMGLFHL